MKNRIALVSVLASLALATAACGSDQPATEAGSADTSSSSSSSSAAPETEDAETESETESETEDAEMASGLVGAGCADYAEAVPDGAGSVDGMAQDPVATAASNNPLLTTLTAAVSAQLNPEVDLVDTLNGDEFTVFAPVDTAFEKLDAATIETLKTDADLLSSILTYHVVPGQLDAAGVVGEQTSVEGGTVNVTGEGDDLMVNGASVICGNVKTANATVYLIDTVLDPTQG